MATVGLKTKASLYLSGQNVSTSTVSIRITHFTTNHLVNLNEKILSERYTILISALLSALISVLIIILLLLLRRYALRRKGRQLHFAGGNCILREKVISSFINDKSRLTSLMKSKVFKAERQLTLLLSDTITFTNSKINGEFPTTAPEMCGSAQMHNSNCVFKADLAASYVERISLRSSRTRQSLASLQSSLHSGEILNYSIEIVDCPPTGEPRIGGDIVEWLTMMRPPWIVKDMEELANKELKGYSWNEIAVRLEIAVAVCKKATQCIRDEVSLKTSRTDNLMIIKNMSDSIAFRGKCPDPRSGKCHTLNDMTPEDVDKVVTALIKFKPPFSEDNFKEKVFNHCPDLGEEDIFEILQIAKRGLGYVALCFLIRIERSDAKFPSFPVVDELVNQWHKWAIKADVFDQQNDSGVQLDIIF